jgi:D-glycero-D-manno-heptose 1,7-bisphosphate phosphatase
MRQSGNLKTGIFLDRDGVIIKAIIRDRLPYSPRGTDDFAALEGVKEALSILYESNIVPVVITNQPDVSRGIITRELVEWQHSKLYEKFGIEHFYICYHDDSESCECRKPKIGLITEASQKLDIDLKGSFLVGDRWRDIQAGQQAGCSCFFIDYQYAEKQPEPPFQKVNSLLEAVRIITGRNDYE